MKTAYMVLLWALILCSASLDARAGAMQIHIASEHADGCDTCNEQNFGVGYIGASDLFGRVAVGYYRNSWFKDSLYAGPNWRLHRWSSLSVVAISGYQGASDSVRGELIVAPLLHVDVGDMLGLRLGMSPLLTYAPTRDGGVVLLSLNKRFGR